MVFLHFSVFRYDPLRLACCFWTLFSCPNGHFGLPTVSDGQLLVVLTPFATSSVHYSLIRIAIILPFHVPYLPTSNFPGRCRFSSTLLVIYLLHVPDSVFHLDLFVLHRSNSFTIRLRADYSSPTFPRKGYALVAHHSLLYRTPFSVCAADVFSPDTRAVGIARHSYQVDIIKKNGNNESLELSESKQNVILAEAALGHPKIREISAKTLCSKSILRKYNETTGDQEYKPLIMRSTLSDTSFSPPFQILLKGST